MPAAVTAATLNANSYSTGEHSNDVVCDDPLLNDPMTSRSEHKCSVDDHFNLKKSWLKVCIKPSLL